MGVPWVSFVSIYNISHLAPNLSIPRQKIENIIKRPEIADPDAPNDPESTRWWANVGGTYTDKERMSVSTTSHANVSTSSGVVSGLLAGPHEGVAGGGQLSLTNGSEPAIPTTGSAPSLKDLVEIMNGPKGTATPKTKAKAKAKARAVTPHAPKTAAEQRDDIRKLARSKNNLFLIFFKSINHPYFH